MEVRKLMAFGNSSFVVSLPKAWVTKNHLRKGDALIVEERPSEIVFAAQESDRGKKLREAIVDLSGKDLAEIKTEVTSLYVNNADVITLTHVEKSNAMELKSILHGLVGMEILEETATRIVAKDFLDVKAFTIPGTLRRADIILRSMMDDSLQVQKEQIASIEERDKEINRLMLLSSRTARAAMENPLLLRQFEMTYWEVLVAKQVVTQMEMFADQVKRISRMLPNTRDKKQRRHLLKIYTKIKEHYYEIMKIYYSKNKSAAFRRETGTRNILKECNAFLAANNSATNVLITEHLKYMVVALTRILRSTMELDA